MTLRCRPGDLAVTVGNCPAFPEHSGLLVDVLYAAPVGRFRLPDGTLAQRDEASAAWVVHMHQPVRVLMSGGATGLATYACCRDALLQPIRGQQQPEAVTTTAPELAHT